MQAEALAALHEPTGQVKHVLPLPFSLYVPGVQSLHLQAKQGSRCPAEQPAEVWPTKERRNKARARDLMARRRIILHEEWFAGGLGTLVKAGGAPGRFAIGV